MVTHLFVPPDANQSIRPSYADLLFQYSGGIAHQNGNRDRLDTVGYRRCPAGYVGNIFSISITDNPRRSVITDNLVNANIDDCCLRLDHVGGDQA